MSKIIPAHINSYGNSYTVKVHLKDCWCGTDRKHHTTTNHDEVTCKKCKRLMPSDKPMKLYKVTVDYVDDYVIEAISSSKATYKCFKDFHYNDEACESIGEQFFSFKKYGKPEVKIVKDTSIKRTLTYEEEHQLQVEQLNKECDDWNSKYPIGTKVWFQRDGASEPIVTTTRSEAQMRGTYLIIWTNADSSSYFLDPKWILPYNGNEDIKALR